MANDYANLGNLPPEIFQQQQELNRQQRMAEMLMGNNQQPQGQMIGNRYVAPSWAAQLAPVTSMLAGAYLGNKGDEQAAKIAQNLRDYKTMENQAVSEAVKAKDWNKVLDLAGQSYTGAGKEYVPSAIAAINPKPTELKQNYQDWLDSGGKGTLLDYQRYAANLKTEHPSFSTVETPQGIFTMNSRTGQLNPAMMNGQQLVGKNPLNETQAKASLYQGTMLNSTKEMQQLEKSGFNPTTFKNQATLSMGSTATGNAMMPENAQRYKQASDAFANAYIRFQSGAGINQDEIQRNLKNMMPSLGDKQGQIEQKQRAREEAIRLMGNVAGSGNQLLTQNQMPTNPVNPSVPNNPATSPAKVATPPMYATNGKTRIVSTDGGNTWQPAGGQ
jgi:hypothetical protein